MRRTTEKKRGLGKPETFNFLGFTHICGRSRRGFFLLHRKTRRDRMRAKLRALKGELKRRMHEPIPQQGRWLGQVVRGYFAYHAVPTNYPRLAAFRYHVTVLWLRTLRRRSQKDWTTVGPHRRGWRQLICPFRASFIPGPTNALPSNTPGGSPVRESRPPGSVRGAPGNGCPYRDTITVYTSRYFVPSVWCGKQGNRIKRSYSSWIIRTTVASPPLGQRRSLCRHSFTASLRACDERAASGDLRRFGGRKALLAMQNSSIPVKSMITSSRDKKNTAT